MHWCVCIVCVYYNPKDFCSQVQKTHIPCDLTSSAPQLQIQSEVETLDVQNTCAAAVEMNVSLCKVLISVDDDAGCFPAVFFLVHLPTAATKFQSLRFFSSVIIAISHYYNSSLLILEQIVCVRLSRHFRSKLLQFRVAGCEWQKDWFEFNWRVSIVL